MNKFVFFISLSIFANSSFASSDYVPVESGYLSATDWLALSENNRSLYAVGVIDGLKFSPVLANGQENTRKLTSCTAPMTGRQIKAIAENYVNARPEKWHEPVHFMIFSSIIEACKVFKK